MKDAMGDRMKSFYESRSQTELLRKVPVIIRLDGKCFHTFTGKFCESSFDTNMSFAMQSTAGYLLRNIQGAKFAYIQSDEISLLLTDYESERTDAWFGYNVQKLCSISASMASVRFNECFFKVRLGIPYDYALFDSRCFNIPREDCINYFIWRQRDAVRNSLNSYCSTYFSTKELEGKNTAERHEMLHTIGKNWTKDLSCTEKNGKFIYLLEGFEKAFIQTLDYSTEPFNSFINY